MQSCLVQKCQAILSIAIDSPVCQPSVQDAHGGVILAKLILKQLTLDTDETKTF